MVIVQQLGKLLPPQYVAGARVHLGSQAGNQSTNADSCTWRPRGVKRWLESWNHPLTVGSPLPTLPLWLSDKLAIPLYLEANYEQTCRDLRIV